MATRRRTPSSFRGEVPVVSAASVSPHLARPACRLDVGARRHVRASAQPYARSTPGVSGGFYLSRHQTPLVIAQTARRTVGRGRHDHRSTARQWSASVRLQPLN
jgi:hypothetical protein